MLPRLKMQAINRLLILFSVDSLVQERYSTMMSFYMLNLKPQRTVSYLKYLSVTLIIQDLKQEPYLI